MSNPAKKIKIVLDTNNLNAYENNSDLNYIENLEKEGLIEIFLGGDTYLDLLNDKSNNIIRKNKFNSKNHVPSTIRLNFSIFGRGLLLASSDKPPLDDVLSRIIFKVPWVELHKNSKIDIKLLEGSILNGIDYFVTEDSKLIEKFDDISTKYKIQIVSRESMRNILQSLFEY